MRRALMFRMLYKCNKVRQNEMKDEARITGIVVRLGILFVIMGE